MVAEMGPDLVDQLTDMVVHVTTHPANHVEVIVWVGDLPTAGFVDAELGLPGEIELGEQRQGPVDG
jgi:hypothetical protein